MWGIQKSRVHGRAIWVWIKTPCCRGPPPLLQTLVADLCVEYCSLQGACRGGVCRRTPPSVTNLCREMAAQACYKANVVDSLPYEVYELYGDGPRFYI